MIEPRAEPAAPAAPARLSLATPAALAVLVVEYLAGSFAFDAKPLGLRDDGWWPAGQVGRLAALAALAALGMVLVGLPGGAARLRALRTARPLDVGAGLRLGLHGASFALLWLVAARIFHPLGPPAGPPAIWLAALAGLALLSAALLLSAAVPPGQGQPLLRALGPLLLGGLLVGAGAWLAAEGSLHFWEPLGPWTLRGAEALLHLVGVPAFSDPATAHLGTDRFEVHIAPECAGFEGVGLMAAFLTAFLVLSRRELRWPQALLLALIGLGGAWLLNLLRVVALVLVGGYLSEAVAVNGFHTRAGWLLFCALALLLVALARGSATFSKRAEGLGAALDLRHPTAAYLLPFLALLAVALLTGLVSRQIDLLYGLRIFAAVLLIHGYRATYRRLSWWQPSPRRLALAGLLGLAAGALFLALAPRPEAASAAAWLAAWQDLPAGARLAWTATRVLGSVLVIPIAEELAFRGYLQRRLVDRDFEAVPAGDRRPAAWLGLGLSALAFGAVHGGFAAGAAAGVLFGLAQLLGGNLGLAIVAHAAANALVAVYVVALGNWWVWM